MKAIRLTGLVCLLTLFLLTTGCGTAGRSERFEQPTELHVAAAASLRFAFEELGARFEEEHGVNVIFQFGSSGNLSQQIASGAPVDLFASANRAFVQQLVDSGDILDDTVSLYAIGRIVLAVNRDSGLVLEDLRDLLSDDVSVVSLGNPEHAPFGLAGRQALEALGLWDALQDKLVYGESISQAMEYVRTGNAPAGILAWSIADVEELHYVLIDDSLHEPLEQYLGIVTRTKHRPLAENFAQLIASPEGQDIMRSYGFDTP